MDHHLIAIELHNGQPYAIKPTEQELQAVLDTNDFIIIDPLTNEFIQEDGTRLPIPTARVTQDGPIIQVR